MVIRSGIQSDCPILVPPWICAKDLQEAIVLYCLLNAFDGEEENEAISDRLQNVWSKRRWTAPKINYCSAPLKREGTGSDNCPALFLLSHPCTEVLILASSTLQVHVPSAL